MTLLGGVLVALALLAGFAVSGGPSRAHLARIEPPARGALIERAEHPEWKQFLIQAAYRRADELDRLRDLPGYLPIPVTPEPSEPPVLAVEPPAPVEQQASLPEQSAEGDADVTNSLPEPPHGGILQVEIGETSSTELPLKVQDIMPPVSKPETLQRPDLRVKVQQRRTRIVKRPKKPAPATASAASATVQSNNIPSPTIQ